ncbi:hypothetical protein THAOC_30610, partial [Thalassiosira oceanica]
MEALKMMGLERPATMSLLLDEVRELGEKATDDSPFVEHNPYVFGKLLDFLRMRRLSKVGLVEDLSFPRVEASQQGRFSRLIEYYFPGDARKLADSQTPWPQQGKWFGQRTQLHRGRSPGREGREHRRPPLALVERRRDEARELPRRDAP